MPLIFESTNTPNTQPYCYGTIEVSDYDGVPLFLQFSLRATNAIEADNAIKAIAIAMEKVSQLKINSVEALVVFDKIGGSNPVAAYGNQRENQGILTAILGNLRQVDIPFPNPVIEILATDKRYLNLQHPKLAAFLNHLKSGKILIKGQVPGSFIQGYMRHVASKRASEVYKL